MHAKQATGKPSSYPEGCAATYYAIFPHLWKEFQS